MASDYDVEAEVRSLFDAIGNDGQPSEQSIKEHYATAIRASHEAGLRESAEVAVAEAYRCGREAVAAETRRRATMSDYDAKTIAGTSERQQALEILGAAIVRIIPEHRASGDAVDHATSTAEALLAKFERYDKLLSVLREENREHRLTWNIADALDDFDGIVDEDDPYPTCASPRATKVEKTIGTLISWLVPNTLSEAEAVSLLNMLGHDVVLNPGKDD